MRNKLISTFLVLMLIVPLVLSAEEPAVNEVELTGTVSNTNDIHPVLKAGTQEYLLMIPRHFDLKDGETVTVKGIEITDDFYCPGPNRISDDETPQFFVKDITINGKTFTIARNYPDGQSYSYGRMGNGYGRGRARGQRGCW